jgi:predicted MFS family arabinose efflux permease
VPRRARQPTTTRRSGPWRRRATWSPTRSSCSRETRSSGASVASFFFAGLRTFIIVFAVERYGVGRSTADVALLVAGLGAVVGILAGGRIGDLLLERGHVNGRLVVSSWSYVVVAASLAPAFLLGSLWLALPFYVLGAAALSAPIPTLDAVRLDVVHPQLWGRAEGVRTLLLIAAEAGAPLLFGVLADRLAGGGAAGLRATFLLALVTVLLAAAILQAASRFYPRELAAAHESVRRGAS